MAEVAKPRIALCKTEGDVVYQRLQKALSAFAEVQEFDFSQSKPFSPDTFFANNSGFIQVFVDRQLVGSPLPTSQPITLFSTNSIELQDILREGEHLLATSPCLDIQSVPLPDLVRLCHGYALGKSTPGVFSLMEKGSLIIGEHVHSFSNVGQLMDQVVQFIETERPALLHRALDIRQMITSLTHEALEQNRKINREHFSVEIQLSASEDKIAFTVRFPLGEIDFAKLPAQIVNSLDFSWFLAWQGADVLQLTEFKQFKEIEVKALIFAAIRKNDKPLYRSLLFQSTDAPAKNASLLTSPKNYTFSLISELQSNKLKRHREEFQQANLEAEDKAPELDPTTKLKLANMEIQIKNLNTLLTQKDERVRETLSMVSETKASAVNKRAELLKVLKVHENNAEALKKEINEREKRVAQLTKQLAEAENKQKDQGANKDDAPPVDLKALEREKQQLEDSLRLEQKKLAMLEAKFHQIKADALSKEKEIIELKQSVEKYKKEAQKAATAVASSEAAAKKDTATKAGAVGNEKELQTKVRDLLAKEEAFKQDIKKLNFKLEAAEKNVATINKEAAEKVKLLEKKLEAAKNKEIELLKKTDEMGQQLKKKAA